MRIAELSANLEVKEQECEAYKMEAKEGMDANESCLRELEEENEKLKTQLAQEQTLKEVFFTCYQKKHGDIKGELFELRKQVEEIRQTRGLSIFRIALDSGVSESAIKRLLNGAHSQEYTIERLLKYVEKQRKPVDYDVALLLAQNQKLLAQNKQLQTENKALREKLIERIQK